MSGYNNNNNDDDLIDNKNSHILSSYAKKKLIKYATLHLVILSYDGRHHFCTDFNIT